MQEEDAEHVFLDGAICAAAAAPHHELMRMGQKPAAFSEADRQASEETSNQCDSSLDASRRGNFLF